jgi:hypothetical protein
MKKKHQNKAWSITEHDTMQWCNLPEKPCSPNGQMMTSSSYPFFRFVFHRLLTEWRSLGRFTLEKGIWRRLITLPIGSIRPRRLAPIWWPAVWEWSSPRCSSLCLWHMAAQRCLHLPWCRWLLCSKHTEVPLLQPPQNLDPKEAILTWAHKVHWKSNPVTDQAWNGESCLQYISIDCKTSLSQHDNEHIMSLWESLTKYQTITFTIHNSDEWSWLPTGFISSWSGCS